MYDKNRNLKLKWQKEGTLTERCVVLEDSTEITYYVPKRYEYEGYNGVEERMEKEDFEDSHAEIPRVEFDNNLKKWALHFSGADTAGYDVQYFTYYFDSPGDILDFMRFPARCSCIE